MVVVAFHDVTKTILADNSLVAGKHGGHYRQLQTQLAVLDMEITARHVSAPLVSDIEPGTIVGIHPTYGGTSG
jgi:hypothetical protein